MDKWLLGRDSIVNKYTKAIRSCHKNMQLKQQRWFVSRWFYHEATSLESSEDFTGLRVVSPERWFAAFLHFVCVRWSLGGRGVGWAPDWCILQSLPPSLWYSNDSNRSVMSLPGTIFPLSVCKVPQWSRSDDVSVHRVSTTAQSLQRGSEWVCVGFVCAVGPAAFAQRRGSAEQNHKTEVLFFIGLAFRDSPSGLVLFKSTMNLWHIPAYSCTHRHTHAHKFLF